MKQEAHRPASTKLEQSYYMHFQYINLNKKHTKIIYVILICINISFMKKFSESSLVGIGPCSDSKSFKNIFTIFFYHLYLGYLGEWSFFEIYFDSLSRENLVSRLKLFPWFWIGIFLTVDNVFLLFGYYLPL